MSLRRVAHAARAVACRLWKHRPDGYRWYEFQKPQPLAHWSPRLVQFAHCRRCGALVVSRLAD